MNIFVINGSPRGKSSNTMKLTNAFLDGINTVGTHTVEIITVADKNIDHCRGCFYCWEKTPGKCFIKDDMSDIFEKYINAEIVIWSFPLYYYGMPSKVKALLDRLLPNTLPDIVIKDDGSAGHPARNNLQGQKHILISSCGFFTVKNNYEALVKQFEIIFCNRLTKILCPQSELFRVPQLSERTGEYLSYVKDAGKEYMQSGAFSDNTQQKLSELLFPAEQFVQMANLNWKRSGMESPSDDAARLLRQMSAIYKPHGNDKDIVFEFYFTELNKTYQLVLGKTECIFKDADFLPYTLRIETPFEVWKDISEGKLDGRDALFQHKYLVKGDFSTITYLSDCFSQKKTS